MKLSKGDKGVVGWWIDRQFANNPLFPEKCIAEKEDGKPGVSKKHVKAYKDWCKTSSKRSQIEEWIDKWLSKSERKALKRAVEKKEKEETPAQS